MTQWSSAKARRVLAALLRIGWTIKRRFPETDEKKATGVSCRFVKWFV
jgi:hypothetical protein